MLNGNSHSSRGSGAKALAVAASAVFGGLVLIGAAPAGAEDPSAGVIVVRHSLIEFERNALIGPPLNSILQDCLVAPGDRVVAGQVLGRLQDQDLRAELKIREAEANNLFDVKIGESHSARAVAKLKRTASLVRRNAASQEEYIEQRLEADAALLEIDQAKYKRTLAGMQLDAARAQLRMRELVSPHGGTVVAVLRHQGESVAPRDPVFQVVDTSLLRVVGRVDVTEAWRLRIGQPARVVVEVAGADLPVEHEVFTGKVVFIDSQIDPVTRTCKIHVNVANRDDLLRAGLETRIEIDPDAPVPARVGPKSAAQQPRPAPGS